MSKLTPDGVGRTACLTLFSALAFGQASYPNRPVKMIVPFAPGGASDFVARIISPKLGEVLGQQIVIENRPGASGNIGMEAAAKAAADGYTIYLGNIGTIAINPAVFQSLSINPQKDFIGDHAGRGRTEHPDRQPQRPGEHRRGTGGTGEGEAGRAQLRLPGIEHAEPPGNGAVHEGRQPEHRAHPLQRRCRPRRHRDCSVAKRRSCS